LSLTKSDADYRAALTPILRHAKSLALIDPWLNSRESRYLDTVTIVRTFLDKEDMPGFKGVSTSMLKRTNRSPMAKPLQTTSPPGNKSFNH